MKTRFLIVDDEPLARKLIASHASRVDHLHCVGECGNALEALNFLRTQPVDLIFLDIQMPEITGLQFAKTLKNPPAIILTTAFRDFAPEAFDIEAIDYLLKPIAFDRFLKAVTRLPDLVDTKKEPLSTATEIQVKSDRRIFKVRLEDIVYVESLDDYVKVHLEDRFIVTRETISTFESRLPDDQFVRIHRSFIINIRLVSSITAEGIMLRGKEFPFGRAFKKDALTKLNVRFDG